MCSRKYVLEIFQKKQSKKSFSKGIKQSSLKMMGCRKKFVRVQEETA